MATRLVLTNAVSLLSAKALAVTVRHSLRSTRLFFVSRASSTTTAASSSRPMTIVDSSSFVPPPVPTGGDFAGLSATFDHRNGALIPVPEYIIPKSLIQWGQAPTCLEVLVSEDEAAANATFSWRRQSLVIFPETGCGIENLQTTKVVEEVDASCIWQSSDFSVRTLHYLVGDKKLRVESSFGWLEEHRVRMVVDVAIMPADNNNGYSFEVQTPIKVILERQTDAVSTQGTVADGGGLDAQRVTKWLGQVLQNYHSFAEKGGAGAYKPEKRMDSLDMMTTAVNFPGNLTLAYGSSSEAPWVVEMGQVFPEERVRQVVRLTLTSPSESTVESWIEPGEYKA